MGGEKRPRGLANSTALPCRVPSEWKRTRMPQKGRELVPKKLGEIGVCSAAKR